MILVRLQGGLGNQMFQYAFAKHKAIENNVELKIDTSLLGEPSDYVKDMVVRHYDLDFFKLKAPFATEKEITFFNGKPSSNIMDRLSYKWRKLQRKYPLIIQDGNKLDKEQLNRIGKNACIIGRWQSEEFFKKNADVIKKEFNFNSFHPNETSMKLSGEMSKQISVGIHVRRGDYYSNPTYAKGIGCLSETYYLDAIELMKNKSSSPVKFYFISDDITWCEKKFSTLPEVTYVEQEKNKTGYINDLWLLKQCKHVIISNSTFAWWGAYLGENKDRIVIAPQQWAKTNKFIPEEIIPDRWIKIENTFEKNQFD